MGDTAKVNPIASVTPVWEADYLEYPPMIRVAMEDGSVQDYALVVKPPRPNALFQDAMESLDRMMEIVVGYKSPENKKSRKL